MRASLLAVALAAFVVVVVVVVGCAPVGSNVTGAGYDDAGCKLSCDRCPPLALCVGVPYVPTCLIQCHNPGDCDVGTCVVVGTPTGPTVCLAPVQICRPVECGDLVAQCRDAMSELEPLPKSSPLCGWKVVHCDSGCDSATGSCK
jgi:hypothetical protein